MGQQLTIFFILASTLILFFYGRWRYDFVAILALLAATITGLIPPEEAFMGFGHPAVITVAAVLALSTALQNSGLVDYIYKIVSKIGGGFLTQLAALNVFIAMISGFMNNIGALAIFLPVTIQIAKKAEKLPSQFLMPVAFSSLLGGMITMIGTPPNIIVAMMRNEAVGEPFGMFDFTPVGLGVALAGVLFLSLLGWTLIPKRKGQTLKEELYEVEGYLTELKVVKDSSCNGSSVREFENLVEGDVMVIGIVRKKKLLTSPSGNDIIQTGDILIVEADSDPLQELITTAGVEIMSGSKLSKEIINAEDFTTVEVVVRTDSPILRKVVNQLHMRWRFGINLLAISRSGARIQKRLGNVRIQAGDVLLLKGQEQSINDALPLLGCLPLQYRGLSIGKPRQIFLSVSIFATAIISAALGYIPIQIAFVLAVVVMHFCGLLRLREIYESIDWPIIILLGALIPVGKALETTGGAQKIADGILSLGGNLHPILILTIVLVGTMFLSDLVNNATAAVLMVPIAVKIAQSLGASPDPFLMGVAIGASCPFLTPIGHQCNTIILGPGGYHFGDYWRVGLPLEIIIVIVAIPLITLFWPFF